MTGEKKMFSSYEKNQDPQRVITFGDGNQGLVKVLGKIAMGVFGLTFDFGFCSPKSQKPTKGLDSGSSFF
jgi:hypothetical protein